ncbi:MAG: cytochrome b N-terminal domain-containing protein [Thermodesulfobacteriota bacterium]
MPRNLLLHFRPRRIPRAALRFSLTWGLGGMAALLIVQQLVSGLLLSFFYEPQPVHAYQSVVHIQETVFLGRLMRNMHHWTGHLLVIVTLLHLLRVFVSRAYQPPRHRNWLVGLGLGLLILIANFSGYLLPWDQLSYWAVTIATSMLGYIPFVGDGLEVMTRGGEEVSGATLQLFYAVHSGLVPALLILLMAYHFWYVRKAGGVMITVGQKSGQSDGKESVEVVPELLEREVAFAALVTCCLLLFSMAIEAPLGSMANPQLTPPAVKAPWYFLGAQELLLHVPAFVAVFVLPLAILFYLVLLPFIDRSSGKSSTIIRAIFYFALAALSGLTAIGICFRGPAMQWVWPW